LVATLRDLLEVLGDRHVVVGRELTKLHEEIFRGKISEAEAHFGERSVRGEVALLVGAPEGEPSPVETEKPDLNTVLLDMKAKGMSPRQAAKEAAALVGVSPREAYNRLVQLGSEAREGEER
jgi:16S rRNA (cytidine1402-2'-O)-methyltransferase